MQPFAAQIGEATKAVESIGLAATIAVLLLLAAGAAGVYFFRYFTGRLDKKDAQLETLQSTYTSSIVAMTNERRDDLQRFEKVLDKNLESQQAVVESQQEIVASHHALVESQKDIVAGQKEVTKVLKGAAEKITIRK